jgi:Ca2+-binding EF-hand superfamily protein
MDHFASSFDADSDGAIDFEEFKALFRHLGGTIEPTAIENARDVGRLDHPMWQIFSTYDLNGDGLLSAYEVRKMMEHFGYKVDESYVHRTMNAFGGSNGDNAIELDEFPALWDYLGGELPAGIEVIDPKPEPEPEPEPEQDQAEFVEQPSSNKAEAEAIMQERMSMQKEQLHADSLHQELLAEERERVVALFNELDVSGNGTLNIEELRRLSDKMNAGWSEDKLESIFRAKDVDGSGELSVDEFLAWWLPRVEELAILAELNEMDAKASAEPGERKKLEDQDQTGGRDDALRKSMLRGHSVGDAVAAVQEGSELTVYLATGKKEHSRFFWVHRDSSDGPLQLCWSKKKGTSKHETEILHEILPGPEIKSAEELFREVRAREFCSSRPLALDSLEWDSH